jgi:hypothetical protein
MLNSESARPNSADVSGNQGTDFRYVPKEGFGWTNGESYDIFAVKLTLQLLSRLESETSALEGVEPLRHAHL